MSSWLRSYSVATILFALSLLFVQTGCSKKGEAGADNPKITKANFDKVKEKMAEKEVVDLLGASSSSKDISGGKEHTWKSGNNIITIGFKDGKVDYQSSQFVN